jgi:phytoene synthase
MSAPALIRHDVQSLASAFAAAREVCRRRARGFLFACSFLPKRKLDGACALYAFRMMIQDVLSAPCEGASGCCGGSGDPTFQLLRARIDDVYSSALDLPEVESLTNDQRVLRAFAHAVREFEVPKSCFLDFIEGRRAEQSVTRYPTWSRVHEHCAAIEGSFARATSCVFGLTHSDGMKHAAMLGEAIRLTQILRDVKDDFSQGRIYLPLEDLARFRYSERDLAGQVLNDHFRELMKFQIERVRALYRESSEGIRWLAGDGSRLAASVILVINEGILDAIEAQDYDVLSRRASLSLGQKLIRAPRAWRLARGGGC